MAFSGSIEVIAIQIINRLYTIPINTYIICLFNYKKVKIENKAYY